MHIYLSDKWSEAVQDLNVPTKIEGRTRPRQREIISSWGGTPDPLHPSTTGSDGDGGGGVNVSQQLMLKQCGNRCGEMAADGIDDPERHMEKGINAACPGISASDADVKCPLRWIVMDSRRARLVVLMLMTHSDPSQY
jgi:hypothetical protein